MPHPLHQSIYCSYIWRQLHSSSISRNPSNKNRPLFQLSQRTCSWSQNYWYWSPGRVVSHWFVFSITSSPRCFLIFLSFEHAADWEELPTGSSSDRLHPFCRVQMRVTSVGWDAQTWLFAHISRENLFVLLLPFPISSLDHKLHGEDVCQLCIVPIPPFSGFSLCCYCSCYTSASVQRPS